MSVARGEDDRGRIRAVLYAAKSTEDRHGSIRTQLSDARQMADREGWVVAGEYQDEGFSAYKGNRGPGLEAARSEAAALAMRDGTAVLVAQHSDRLARGAGDAPDAPMHLVEVMFWARRSNIQLRSVQDDANLTNPLLAAMIGERNYEDSKRKGEATRAGIRRRVERGDRNGGQRPYGYRFAASGLVPVDAEAGVVRRIFREVASGATQAGIARDLNREGVRTARGHRWSQPRISALIRNSLYIGQLRSQGETLEGRHQPIIDPDLWSAVQELIEARSEAAGGGRGRRPTGNHLFSGGMLRCGWCSEAMRPITRGRHEYYICSGAHSGASDCKQSSVPRRDVDSAAFKYFGETALDVEATREQLADAYARQLKDCRALLKQAELEEQRADAALARIRGDYKSGQLPVTEWLDLRTEIESERAAARAAVERLRGQEAQIHASVELRDVELDVLEHLADLRRAVAGGIRDTTDVDAIRAVLGRVFSHFELVQVAGEPFGDEERGFASDLGLSVSDGTYWLEPHVRPQFLERYAEQGRDKQLWPVIRRVALPTRGVNTDSGR